MGDADFWADRQKADLAIKELGELNDLVGKFKEVAEGILELEKSFSEDRFYEVKRSFRQLELTQLFFGPYDKRSAILGFYPGAGGEDAEDWTRMLFEMYMAYAAKRKWQIAILDDNPNRRTLEVRGEYAYGYLKREMGVHRLVRISPFSAKQLRHT